MNVLVVNAGSSSLKLSVIGPDDQTLATSTIERWESGDTGSIRPFIDQVGQVDAVAHRVVHGGERYRSATVIDDETLSGITALTDLAPLHQPRALAGINATRALLGSRSEVACFDTSFHADIPAANHTYALPAEWRQRWPLRRYGFHGLSHQYAGRKAAEITGTDQSRTRTVSCHLGSGASACAIKGLVSVDTTMGFTPLEGLVMGTRSGSVDPGLIMWLINQVRLDPVEVSEGLEQKSGLAGLGGGSGDMRDILDAADKGDERARLAFAIYIHRLVQSIAGMAVSLGGIDIVVFTGGVGENSPAVRKAATAALGFLGIVIDLAANDQADGDADITGVDSKAHAVVVTAREDLEMARQTRTALGG